MKIFHGPKSWNQTAEKNSRADKRLGFDSVSYTYVKLFKNPFLFFKLLFKYKIYNFYAAYTFFPVSTNHPILFKILFGLDIYLLALFKKKVVLHFQGCELRYRYALPSPEVCNYCSIKEVYCKKSSSESRRNVLKKQFKRVDAVCVTTPDLLKYVDHPNKYWVPKIMELPGSFTKEFGEEKQVLKVFHATTSRAKKGTEKIMEVINKHPEKFELVFAEGKTNEEVFRLAKQCDLVVDQLYIGWYGNFTVEMMALGLPVLVNVSEELEIHLVENNIPIINVNTHTLEKVLLKMHANQSGLEEVGAASKKFADSFHSEKEISLRLKNVYHSVGIDD